MNTDSVEKNEVCGYTPTIPSMDCGHQTVYILPAKGKSQLHHTPDLVKIKSQMLTKIGALKREKGHGR